MKVSLRDVVLVLFTVFSLVAGTLIFIRNQQVELKGKVIELQVKMEVMINVVKTINILKEMK